MSHKNNTADISVFCFYLYVNVSDDDASMLNWVSVLQRKLTFITVTLFSVSYWTNIFYFWSCFVCKLWQNAVKYFQKNLTWWLQSWFMLPLICHFRSEGNNTWNKRLPFQSKSISCGPEKLKSNAKTCMQEHIAI